MLIAAIYGRLKLKDHLSKPVVLVGKENIQENNVYETDPHSPQWASKLLAAGKPLIMKPFYL